MQGRRVYQNNGFLPPFENGDYGKHSDEKWYAKTPNGYTCGLGNHSVIEHEDGTITVSPSILVSTGPSKEEWKEVWHGYLERGIWRTC